MHFCFTFLLFMFLMCSSMGATYAQDVDGFLWKNRLVVIISSVEESTESLQQLNVLLADRDALSDRKIIILQVEQNRYRYIFPAKQIADQWIVSTSPFQKMANQDKEFEVLLLGLDGGTKMRSHELLSADTFFDRIDSMPMRQSELRNRKQ